jgi:hypothetical protein
VGTDLLLWWCSRQPAASSEGYLISYVRDALRRRRMPLVSPVARKGV